MTQPSNALNQVLTHLLDLTKEKGPPPWSVRVIQTREFMGTLICHAPGASSRAHWHDRYDECWVVMQGELVWEIDGMPPVHAKAGDFVRVPMGKVHRIRTVGAEPSLRFAFVAPDVPHLDPQTGKPW